MEDKMKKLFMLFLFFMLFLHTAFAYNVREDSMGRPLYAADKIKVKLSEVASERLNSVLSENGDFSRTGLDGLDDLLTSINVYKITLAHRPVADKVWEQENGFNRWYLLSIPVGTDIEGTITYISTNEYIEHAIPEYIFYWAATPNDTYFDECWGHDNTAQLPSYNSGTSSHTGPDVGTVGFDSHIEEAWDDTQGYGSSSIILAIIDSGVDYNHVDLDDNCVAGYDFGSNDNDPMDEYGHGTCCAGIAAAEVNNSIGVSGVAGNCKIMPLKISVGTGGPSFTAAANALTHCGDNNVDVASMSFSSDINPGVDPTMTAALEYAYDHGVTLLAATGNNNQSHIRYPANYSHVIAVGAASPCEERKDFLSCDGEDWWGSNYGVNTQDAADAVDVIAPTILPSTDITGAGGFSAGDYDMYFNGTSCATPYVAGVAALIKSKDPSLTPAEIRNILRSTATDVVDEDLTPGWDRYTGYGMVNADAAVGLTNTWTGDYNHYWGNATNWSLGHVPDATEDVVIPNVNMPCIVDYSDKVCNSITIQSGATVEIQDQTLTVNGDATVHGTIDMLNTLSRLSINNDIFWEAGSSASMTGSATIYVYGTWEFKDGANVYLNGGYVDFQGSYASYIRSKDDDSYFHHIRNNKSSSYLGNSSQSNQPLNIFGNLYIYSGCELVSYSSQPIVITGFINNMSGSIHLDNGTIKYDGVGSTSNFMAGDYFNNLTISSSGTNTFDDDLEIKNDVLIESGVLNPDGNTLTVGGDWTNSVGAAGFTEGTGRVIFNGSSHQYVNSNETFNILEVDCGAALRVNNVNHTVTCSTYDWTSGGIDVLSGTFTALDLENNGLFGGFWVNPGGTINLTNDGWVDLNGEIHNYGGTINVSGTVSDWPYSSDAEVEMTDGVIDFKTCGINIDNNAHDLINNITGGTIRTAYGFTGDRTDFNPTGGTIELYGPTNANLSMGAGSNFYNVEINKATKTKSGSSEAKEYVVIQNRDGTEARYEKSDGIIITSDVVVNNNLEITNGHLTLNGNHLSVTNDMNVYGSILTNTLGAILTVGSDYHNALRFYSGSSGILEDGTTNIYGWIRTDAGCSFTTTTNNTIYFKGVTGGGPWNDEASAVYGHMVVDKNPGERTYVSGSSTEPHILQGDLTINPNNKFEIQNKTVMVHGVVNDYAASEMYVWDATDKKVSGSLNINEEAKGIRNSGSNDFGTKGGILEIDTDFTLNGLMAVGDGDVLVHGEFELASTGTLTIDGGSFISDAAYAKDRAWQNLWGTMNLTDGLFEITNNHISIQSSFVDAITGGIIRCGGTFRATNAGTFEPSGGIVELTSNDTGYYISCTNGNYFNNLQINGTQSITLYDNTTVKNDLLIMAGALISNDHSLYVGGDWSNYVGDAGFLEGNGRVVFNKSTAGVQFIQTDEHFNILENAASVDGIRPAYGTDVVCDFYDWTSGILSATYSTFTAYDLIDDGLYGKIYALSSAEIYLNQNPGQYVDLFCSEIIVRDDAILKIIGGDDESFWCTTNPLDIEIEPGGVLDFDGHGIDIFNTSVLTEEIEGTIRTSGWFTCRRSDFTPAAGTVELYGQNDAYLSMSSGSEFYNLEIDKQTPVYEKSTAGKEQQYDVLINRDGTIARYSRSNTVLLASDCVVDNKLTITEGALTLNGHELTVNDDLDVYGTLNMTNAADVLNVGTNNFDNLTFYSGSTGNISNGAIYLQSWIWPQAGCSFTASTSNTIYFIGSNTAGGLANDAPSTVYGNIDVNKSANYIYIDGSASEPIIVNGDFVIHAGNVLDMQHETLEVHGDFTDDATSSVYLNYSTSTENATPSGDINSLKDSGPRGGYLKIDTDFTLNGLMDVGDGNVLLHGLFELASTGTLTIDGGSFISDAAYAKDRAWNNIYGDISLNDGLLEITNNSLQFVSGAHTITGGSIRVGHIFYALNSGVFQPTGGVVEMINAYPGGSIVCSKSDGNYFHDLVIDDDAPLSTDITINNNLEILTGSLMNTYGLDIDIGGNWTNNVGDAGFYEGTGTVTFNGSNDALITTSEKFFNLVLNKTPSKGDVLEISAGDTLIVTYNFNINDGVFIVNDNSHVHIGNALNVNNGGTLDITCSAGNQATLTHTSGYYGFNIESGGTISAEYCTFEYMDVGGVYVKSGAIVDTTHAFNYCTFQNGVSGYGTLLTLNNDQTLTCTGAHFPGPIVTTHNVWKGYDSGHVTFIDATGDFAGEAYEHDPYNRIDWTTTGLPDLTITNAAWSTTNPYVCNEIAVDVTVKNIGNADVTGWFFVDLYYDPPSPPVCFQYGDQAYQITSGLAAGDSMIVPFTMICDSMTGTWHSYAQVDADSNITESDESNNVWGPDVITWQALPVIDDLTISYSDIAAKGSIELSWSYSTTVDSFYIYRDTDPYFTPVTPHAAVEGTTYTWGEPASGTKYFYQVTAVKSCPTGTVVLKNQDTGRINLRNDMNH